MTSVLNLTELGSHIINGQEIGSRAVDHGQPVESINPFSGETVWIGQSATSETLDAAIAAARAAFPAWARLGFERRHELLSRFVQLVQEQSEALTRLIATEAGKPLWRTADEAVQEALRTLRSAGEEPTESVAMELEKAFGAPHRGAERLELLAQRLVERRAGIARGEGVRIYREPAPPKPRRRHLKISRPPGAVEPVIRFDK